MKYKTKESDESGEGIEAYLSFDEINSYVDISDYRQDFDGLKTLFGKAGLNLLWSRLDLPQQGELNPYRTAIIGEVLSGPQRIFPDSGIHVYHKVKIGEGRIINAWIDFDIVVEVGSKVIVSRDQRYSSVMPGIAFEFVHPMHFSGERSVLKEDIQLPPSAPVGVLAMDYYLHLDGNNLLLFVEGIDSFYDESEFDLAMKLSKILGRPLKTNKKPHCEEPLDKSIQLNAWNGLTLKDLARIKDHDEEIEGVVMCLGNSFNEVLVDIGVLACLKNARTEMNILEPGLMGLRNLRGQKFKFKIESYKAEWPRRASIFLRCPRKF